MKLTILDSTLRDGLQGEGVSFSESDKRKVILALDKLGIAYIEAGNPASNPKDADLFQSLRGISLSHAQLVAFGSTRRKNSRADLDAGLKGLLRAGTQVVSLFGKTSPLHVRRVLETTLEENLAMIRESVAFLKEQGRRVIYDAEHFFDGYALDPQYALETLRAALQGGAEILCLCDTNGATYPADIAGMIRAVSAAFPGVCIGIHCHNDCGLAVAGSMEAVRAGASHVQGTLLGFGERCGNADLSTLIPNLQLKQGYSCIPRDCMPSLTATARKVADIANFSLPGNRPYVGGSAFAHKGGMHIDGVTKIPSSFEHVSPESVGNRRKFLMSEISGKSGLLARIQKYDPSLTKTSPKTQEILEQLKALEYRGYQFEAAEESFDLVIRRALGLQRKYFTLDHFKTIGEQPLFGRLHPSSAMVKIRVGEESQISAAEGNGPINALDLALRGALTHFYPSLAQVRLTDYKVRVLESDATTAATVRVLIESTDGEHTWTTVGVSTDIIEASFLALRDSIEYKLAMDEDRQA